MGKRCTLVGGLVAFSWLASAHIASSAGAGKVYTLCVGVDDYRKESIADLKFAGADAKLVSQALKETMGSTDATSQILTSDAVRENNQPSKKYVQATLENLCSLAGPQDTLIFFFAGHGVNIDGGGYLMCEDSDNLSSTVLQSSSLSGTEISSLLTKSRASNVILLLDACRNDPSGRVLEGKILDDFKFSAVARRSMTLFSCSANEKSYEWVDKQHGFFTYFLVNGLRTAGGDDGSVTVDTLKGYVSREVTSAAKQYAGAAQNPHFYADISGGQWVLGHAPPSGAKSKSAAGDNAMFVAKIDLLQAQVDKSTAMLKAAEDKAIKEAARATELETRLALLEKQAGGSAASPSKDQTAEIEKLKAQLDMALEEVIKLKKQAAGGSSGPQANLDKVDALRLATENKALQERVAVLETQLKGVAAVSRDVKLESSFEDRRQKLEKDLELQRLNQGFGQVVAAPDLNAKLAAMGQYKVGTAVLNEESQLLRDRLDYMERTYAPSLTQGDPQQVAFYKDTLNLLRLGNKTLDSRIAAAERAASEARGRETEGQLVNKQLAQASSDVTPDSAIRQMREENAQLRKDVARLGEENRRLQEELAKKEEAYHQQWSKNHVFSKNWADIRRRGHMADISPSLVNVGEEADELPPR